jgi:hypothetical protein
LLSPEEARAYVKASPANREVLFPYLNGDDLVSRPDASPSRYAIDFHPRDLLGARKYKALFDRVHELVLPTREEAAQREASRNRVDLAKDAKARVNLHHQNFLKRWWLFSYPREELITKIAGLSRYAVCCQVTKRPIFEFIAPTIRPNAQVIVFPMSDDYSFGILQSGAHWEWFKARCSTLKGDFRYTSNTVFDTFPWPQAPKLSQVQAVASAAVDLRMLRRKLMREHGMNLRQLYASLEDPGKHPLRDAHAALDAAVRAAYGMKAKEDVLAFLMRDNHRLAEREANGEPVVGPGLPPSVHDPASLITADCVKAPKLG